ncbi:threonine aldolase family protein [Stagnihabitans tardus]|uniref:L-threonine aldolase n=1 Tax=Stagnihabitans tardus TaxID=2699202 RepID=A0AAE4Y957_9RHOB|nr:low specificity L-threonine aldolase [Stagnihabitans tardus]NBZ88318.1 low specificity L-threonine aldolase [Stagnihabitans tardus]
MFFASDNTSGVAPQIMAAMVRANEGYMKSYGADAIMARVRARIRALFEAPEAEVHLVATGTAANALSLALITQPWAAVFAHETAHIAVDECGAPEFYTGGAKLIGIPGEHGKVTPEGLSRALGSIGESGVHGVQRGCLSLTNVTEAGTVYTPAEIAALTALAKARGLPCHLDGARFANALVATGATPAEMTWKAGIDVLSFGGTKNGCMGVEAVVLFDPSKAWELELRRKRAGHLFSKHRFLSAQFEAYLEGDLWLTLAQNANAMGQSLVQGLARVPGASLRHPAPANMLFPWLAPGTNARAAERGAQYYAMQEGAREYARFVASWSTTQDDVDALISALCP